MGHTPGQSPPSLTLSRKRNGEGLGADYARQLLKALGITPPAPVELPDEHPALAWARSGAMALTGHADGDPWMCPAPLAACADGALAALRTLAPATALRGLRGSELLAERAAIAGYTRRGTTSPGGSCRLLRAADGWVAVNLARDEDWALLPAWLEGGAAADWETLAPQLQNLTMHDLVERARLLGLAVSPLVPPPTLPACWYETQMLAAPQQRPGDRPPLVLDLSSLWAGPLCGHLLQLAGARVIKIESSGRPDGARNGPREFFDLINAGKQSVALDLAHAHGREQLRALIARADIVIEASRPRALRQLGIVAEDLVREVSGLTWLSISGYGRGREPADNPPEQWVAYGDDAGVGAGLSWLMRQCAGEPCIVGDAIADPLTGLHAALAAWSAYRAGGGRLVSLALCDVVRHCIQFHRPAGNDGWRMRQQAWAAMAGSAQTPRARQPAGQAAALGADTQAVLDEFGIAC